VRPCEVDRRKELLTGASGTPYDYFLEQLRSEGGLRTSGSPVLPAECDQRKDVVAVVTYPVRSLPPLVDRRIEAPSLGPPNQSS
jgi:hypothetical protein